MKIETKNCSKCFNKNCWLVNALGYAPYGRCQFCDLKFRNCLFLHYQIISIVLIIIFFGASFLIYGRVSELVIISVFILSVVYGYFFNSSTEKIIKSNFFEKQSSLAFKELSSQLEEKVAAQTKEIKTKAERMIKLLEMRSSFLDIASHSGLLSLFFYVAFWIVLLWNLQRFKKKEPDSQKIYLAHLYLL